MTQNDDAYALARLASNVTQTGTVSTAALPPSGNHNHAGTYSYPDHTHAGGSHPDLATHTGLGLAAIHSHPFSDASHDHAGVYEPTHAHPYEASGTVAAHSAAGDPHPAYLTTAEANVAYEASGAVTTHAGASDPHPTYLTVAEGDAAYIHAHPYAATSHVHVDGDLPASIARDSEVTAAVSAHEAAGNPHASYATDADLTTHAAGPHGGGGAWTTIVKTADESKNNSAAVADDALLKFTTSPNTNYMLRIRAFFLTNATADIKYRLTHAGTTTRVRRRVKRTATTDVAQTIALLTAFDVGDIVLSTTGLNPWLEEDIILQVGASGGLLVLRWGQVTSNAGPTTCLEGSYLEYAVT